MTSPINIGVSSCLLGEQVRYDGGHKHNLFITDTLGRFFNLVGVCPEVGCGLPIPREAMHLEGDPDQPRLVTSKTKIDKTDQMLGFCRQKVVELEKEDLCGFIFKKNSPSSGLFRVKVYKKGIPAPTGRGLFAAAVVGHFPLLPVEEEGRLNDAVIRGNFIERIFSYHRWKDFLLTRPGIGELVDFHAQQKLLIMSHSIEIYRELGRLVAQAKGTDKAELFRRYEELFMKALALNATTKKNTNVQMHIMGYFKNQLSTIEKAELLGLINQYHDHLVPLIVPLTLLKHYVTIYDQPYLKRQVYLSPHPAELMLRNHV
ncbi:MAG TPA: DUF523 and DUF1722 domain-containing protein [Desulfuromonadaceae bacterium]|jgi:uncharacterized protein YbgA (DUF1722 family)/uncharacterized protein YbbK (DUF523 family)